MRGKGGEARKEGRTGQVGHEKPAAVSQEDVAFSLVTQDVF